MPRRSGAAYPGPPPSYSWRGLFHIWLLDDLAVARGSTDFVWGRRHRRGRAAGCVPLQLGGRLLMYEQGHFSCRHDHGVVVNRALRQIVAGFENHQHPRDPSPRRRSRRRRGRVAPAELPQGRSLRPVGAPYSPLRGPGQRHQLGVRTRYGGVSMTHAGPRRQNGNAPDHGLS